MALLDPGDSTCGSGIAKDVYDRIKNEPKNGFASGLSDDRFDPLRALVWGHVKGIVDSINAAGGVGGGGGGAPTWHTVGASGEPALQNGWVPYDTGGIVAQPGFCKDSAGRVYLRGAAKLGTVTTANPVPMFVLPTGYRPAYRCEIITSGLTGVGSPSGVEAKYLRLDQAGNVYALAGANFYFGLDGISFGT